MECVDFIGRGLGDVRRGGKDLFVGCDDVNSSSEPLIVKTTKSITGSAIY